MAVAENEANGSQRSHLESIKKSCLMPNFTAEVGEIALFAAVTSGLLA